ncbi:MAG: choice-of-anchor V domain-containing protein [Candidatus Kapaibacterium sp.]
MKKNIVFSIAVLLTVFSFIVSDLHAYPGGIAGRTKKTSTAGCGGCHAQGTSITGVITGLDTVTAGQTYTFTLTLTTTGGSGKYGVDIAAKTGTLTAISGQGLVLMSNELVQSSGITWVNPKVLTFSYTAPVSAGTDTLYATVDRGHTGIYNWAPNKGVIVKLATGIVNNEIPVKFYLSQNFPNPFNPVTKINYGVANATNVSVKVFDLLGKEVATLVNEYQASGNYFTTFDATLYPTGIYYYRIQAGDFTEVRKMSLIK